MDTCGLQFLNNDYNIMESTNLSISEYTTVSLTKKGETDPLANMLQNLPIASQVQQIYRSNLQSSVHNLLTPTQHHFPLFIFICDGALWGMLLGTVIGLIAYFQIGWYAASLIGAAVSMVVTIIASMVSKQEFDWNRLNEESIQPL